MPIHKICYMPASNATCRQTLRSEAIEMIVHKQEARLSTLPTSHSQPRPSSRFLPSTAISSCRSSSSATQRAGTAGTPTRSGGPPPSAACGPPAWHPASHPAAPWPSAAASPPASGGLIPAAPPWMTPGVPTSGGPPWPWAASYSAPCGLNPGNNTTHQLADLCCVQPSVLKWAALTLIRRVIKAD